MVTIDHMRKGDQIHPALCGVLSKQVRTHTTCMVRNKCNIYKSQECSRNRVNFLSEMITKLYVCRFYINSKKMTKPTDT